MKKKGFTLIELLAVIVVLAVIALIAIPLVLNTIEEVRVGAAKASALTYIKEVERYMVISQMDGSKPKLMPGEVYQISNTKYEEVALIDLFIERVNAQDNQIILNDLIQIKGDYPKSGTVKIGNDNTVEKAELIMGNYDLSCTSNNCAVKGTKEEIEEPDDEMVLKGDQILDKAKALVYDANGTCKTDGTTYNYMGGCYIKGASTNNYVWYNGFMWRIMGINSDNTVRMITDENVTSLAYGPSNTALTYTTNEGYIHDWLTEYFFNNLNSTKDIIQQGAYFCSESTNSTALTEGRTTCTEANKVAAPIGLMSIDEYILAGTSSSYLNIAQYSWTMTPYSTSDAWRVHSNGNAINNAVTYAHGVRPVINVSPNSTITAGDGTASNFYVLEENKSTNITGILSDKVTSGEYVSLEGHTYRVVRKENDGIKLILDGFYEETAGTIYTMSYGSNNTFSLTSGIGAKLNGDVLNWLGLSTSNKIVQTTYYQGDRFSTGSAYTTTLKKSNGVYSKVGLIQVGDILASQSSTMLTKNYTVTSNYSNTKIYWTMNKYTGTSYAWYVSNAGSAFNHDVTNAYGVRPVIKVRTDLTISGGNGTWKSPYQI